MKNLFLLIVIILILTWPSNGGSPFGPKVNPDLFVSELESMGVGGLFVMVDGQTDSDVVPTPTTDCQCNKQTGMISYDGGTSLVKCPCALGGKPCGCINSKKIGDSPTEEPQEETQEEIDLSKYYVLKFTAPWCGACIAWENANIKDFDSVGLEVKPFNYDSNKKLAKDMGVESLPSFVICTKEDNLYHFADAKRTKVYGRSGSEFTLSDALEEISKLDDHLKNKKSIQAKATVKKVSYKRQQSRQWTLNGKLWATRSEYIRHLRTNANHRNDIRGWPLEKLSQSELKAIHDDDHAHKLGKLNGV
jgi:thiol-disulfide isomerase/thioredoxin